MISKDFEIAVCWSGCEVSPDNYRGFAELRGLEGNFGERGSETFAEL